MSKNDQRPPLPNSKPSTPSPAPAGPPVESPEETKRQVAEMLATKREPVLAVGRIVMYVLKETEDLEYEVRPAIVTRVWSKTCANITVFPDGSNDFPLPRVPDKILGDGKVIHSPHPGFQLQFAVSSPNLDQEKHLPGTFHFPEID